MTKIIVSYRRSDTSASAGRIFDRLTHRYGEDSVFMDVDNIPFGIDFRTHIKGELLASDILVAVIGPRWFGTATDGQHRIAEETDPVRVEVETALQAGVPVLPVLVDGATMPNASQLPDALKELAFINAAPVDMGRDFRQHMDRLIRAMDGILAARAPQVLAAPTVAVPEAAAMPAPASAPRRLTARPMLLGFAGLVVVAGAGAVLAPRLMTPAPTSVAPRPSDTSGPPVTPAPQPIPLADPLPERPPVIAMRPRMPDDTPAPAASPAAPPIASAPAAPPPSTATPGAGTTKTFRVIRGVSEGKLNMRDGPGTNYRIVGEIPAGAGGITIGTCRMPDDKGVAPWCEANWQQKSGWVSSRGIVDEKTGAYPQ